jgi:hypothetical protein
MSESEVLPASITAIDVETVVAVQAIIEIRIGTLVEIVNVDLVSGRCKYVCPAYAIVVKFQIVLQRFMQIFAASTLRKLQQKFA